MLLKEYLSALWPHWWSLMSCAAFTVLAFITGHPKLEEKLKHWGTKGSIILAVFFFLLASYLAWMDEYKENQASRDIGVLTLDHVEAGHEHDAASNQTGQAVALVLKNSTSKLIKYHVDSFDLAIDSHTPASGNYVNRGGYVYASQFGVFRSLLIPDWQGSEGILRGKLHYAITYNVVGSKQNHHSAKVIEFPVNGSTFSGVNYITVTEYED